MGIAGENLTFLYADIEKSTEKWEQDSDLMSKHVRNLFEVLQTLARSHDGSVFKSLGDGLGLYFGRPEQAIEFAVAAQIALVENPLSVRIGIHAGEAVRDDLDFQGPALNLVARITDLGHGGQILISEETASLVSPSSPHRILRLGKYRLKGIRDRIAVCQVNSGSETQSFPPLRNALPEATLPSPERTFFGRTKERKDLLARLADPKQRLITILGFGGMGKTTLAQVIAQEAEKTIDDGVWWVNCEGLSTLGHLYSAIAAALGVENSLDSICEHVGSKSVLVVLDCYEELAAAGQKPDALLQQCAHLKLLVTSRVLVGSAHEYEFELRGLFENRGGLKDAVALFVDTANKAKRQFEPTTRDERKIRALVKLLDCIPLAIILVASRLRHMTLEELDGRVRISILSSAKTVSLEEGRHSNLRKVIQMSFSLLQESERSLLTQISVFRGGFNLGDAAAVLESTEIEDGIARLRDHSLVFADELDRLTRFRLLDSVSEYAREDADSEIWKAILHRHSKHYLLCAERVNELFASHDWRGLSRLTSLEGSNLRQGFRTAIASDDVETVLAYGRELCEPYAESGLVDDFRMLGNAVLEAARSRSIVDEQLRILGLLAITAKRNGDPELAMTLFVSKLNLAAETSNVAAQADAIGDILGMQLQLQNRSLVVEYLERYSRLNPRLEGDIAVGHLLLRARCEAFVGNLSAALIMVSGVEVPDESEPLAFSKLYILTSLAEVLMAAGDDAAAERLLLRVLETSVEGQLPFYACYSLCELARVWLHDLEKSKLCVEAALSIPRSAAPAVRRTVDALAAELKAVAPKGVGWQTLAKNIVDLSRM